MLLCSLSLLCTRVLKSDRTRVSPVTGGNRLNSNPNSNKFKFSRATGSDRFTGRFDGLPAGFTGLPVGLTGLKFKSSRATGLPAGLTGLPTGLTGLLAGLIGGPSWAGPFFFFFFFDLTLNSHKLY